MNDTQYTAKDVREEIAATRHTLKKLDELIRRADKFELAGTTRAKKGQDVLRDVSEQWSFVHDLHKTAELVRDHLVTIQRRLTAVEDASLEPIRRAAYENGGHAGHSSSKEPQYTKEHPSKNLQLLDDITGASMVRAINATYLHSLADQ